MTSTQIVIFNPKKRNGILSGDICPPQDTVKLKFNFLTSELGLSTQSLEIPVQRRYFTDFEGFKIPTEEYATTNE